MRPIFYEMRKTVTNWKFILVVVLLVLFTSLIVYSSVRPQPTGSVYNLDQAAFYSNGNYYTDSIVFNGFGAPQNNAYLQISLMQFSINGSRNYIESWSATTDKGGYGNITIPGSIVTNPNKGAYVINTNLTVGGALQLTSTIPLTNYAQYNQSTTSRYFINPVTNKNNPYVPNILVQYLSLNGTASPKVDLYYYASSAGSIPFYTNTINSSFVKIGSYSNFNSLLLTPQFNASSSEAMVALTFPGNNTIVDNQYFYYSSPQTNTFENSYFSGVSLFAIFFMSIAGVIGGYVSFGKDRATGVLENVLARPIKRSNIILSRYIASATVMTAMSFILAVVDYAMVALFYGVYLPTSFLLVIGFGLTVTSLAFLGLTFLFSNLTKSTGTLIGFSILILVFFIFAWSIITLIIPLSLGLYPGSSAFNSFELLLSYFSPYNFSTLAYSLINPSYPGTFGSNLTKAGLNWYSLITYGVLWVFIPIFLAFLLYRSRD